MMIVALILRAWTLEMKAMGLNPRVLADDLQVVATGAEHLDTFVKGFDATHKHLECTGAKLAPHKSVAFSTEGTARNWLKQHCWRRVGRTIEVLSNCRDLGAHVNFSKYVKYETTLTARLRKAASYVRRIARTKAPYLTKIQLALAKGMPMGVYGCETCPINEQAMKDMMGAMADVTTYTTSRRSLELAFAVAASEGWDPDPDVEAGCRRFTAFRRHATKDNETGRFARMNLEDYCNAKAKGTEGEDTPLDQKTLGGIPTSRSRMELRRQCDPHGPVGFMLETAHINAGKVDRKGVLRQHGQPPIDILGEAYQDLRKLVRENLSRNRTAAAEGIRREHEGLKEIDPEATKAEVNNLDADEKWC